MSIAIQNKLDTIIELLKELLQEVKKPSHPTQGEDTEWHNPENVSIEQLCQGYRFLKPWEADGRFGEIADIWIGGGEWGPSSYADSINYTYRVPSSTPIHPKP